MSNEHASIKEIPSAKMNKGNTIRKLLGRPVAATPNESIDSSTIDSPQLRPSASQHTTYSAGAPIACLDRSADGKRAVVAGPKVFKILKVEGSTITEELDLRAIITSYAPAHDPTAATQDQLNIKAVKWSHGALDTTIVTACGNGRITVYDLNRVGEGLEVGRIQEHTRQVHKLAINPFKCEWLLSASQDGTVKWFDISKPIPGPRGPTFKTIASFKCNAEAVRDVKWSPTTGTEFACCTDSGMIQKWNISRNSSPYLKFAAHSHTFSIAWHPDGDHLISSGMDQLCHVWDMKSDSKQKPRYTFATAAVVSSVSWRPACWSATAQGNRAAQVTVAYDDLSTTRYQTSAVHIWDLARPSMPFKEIEQWNASPTGLLWNTRDLLWSVDREGHFTQTDVAFVPKVIDRRGLSTFAFSPTGTVLMLLEERPIPRRRSRPSITSPEVSPSFQHVSNTPQFSASKSDSEEDVVGSFLGPRQPKGHRRRNSGRSTQSLSTTPPNVTGMVDNNVMSLEEAVLVTGLYKPQQVMAIGHAPSTAKRQTYQYFTNRYLLRMVNHNSSDFGPTNVRTALILEHFGRTAERVGHYRLAQTWRLLGYTMNLFLTRRAEYHRKSRLAIPEPQPKDKSKGDPRDFDVGTEAGGETPRKPLRSLTPHDSPRHQPRKSISSEDIESTSNVATPLVRPIRDSVAKGTREAMHTPMTVEEDILKLPDPVNSPSTSPSPIPVPGAAHSDEHKTSSVEGYDFYGMGSPSPEIDYHASLRKPPLRLDYLKQDSPPQRIEPKRHDSGESFQMFSTSGESHQTKFLSSSSSDTGQSLRDRVSSWENSLTNNGRHRPSVDSDVPMQSESSNGNYVTDSQASSVQAQNGISFHPSFPPVFRIQEASVPSINNNGVTQSTIEKEPNSPQLEEKVSEDPNIIESDFLPWPRDPDFTISPINPTVLVKRAITFETQTGALNAAAMILLLRPLLPDSAIDDIQANAILMQYHRRLTTLKLFTEAALLRNLSVPTYPAVFGPAQENISVGYFCTDCSKPLDPDPVIPNSVWRCPRCQQAMDACAICRQRELDTDLRDEYEADGVVLEAGAVWFLCPGCGHGGHSACMQAWHSGPQFHEGEKHSGGCCPLEGCLHPCLPGSWRDHMREEKQVAHQSELDSAVRIGRAAGPRSVRRDQREVNQSKAVEGVRVALGVGAGAGLVRQKSVKLVAPGEEGG
ncbi:putative WD repeat-containing protein C4F8.11 [Lachnellula cervina]|uniref:Putative WD repeat-containing protein C4F8.11 n=1 Tax=Lachnellula cervina TaxID=1316786 RepID=A0A7D8YQ11_9HELO|nr:putative WD repeat-containing protein C4F8.11 [Lachnellula cervina]